MSSGHRPHRHSTGRQALSAALCGLCAVAVAAPAGDNGEVLEPARILLALDGEQVGDGFGWVAEDLGDIDGDRIADFVVSAPFQVDAGGTLTGRVYVYSGSGRLIRSHAGPAGERAGFGASAAGDADGDGVTDYVYGSLVRAELRSGASGALLHAWAMPGEFAGFDVHGAGDLDRDGAADVLIGAPRAAYAGIRSGRVYAFSGRDGRLLWAADGSPGANLGRGVGPVGDVNFDHVPDVVGCAPGADGGRGEAYVLSGRDGSRLRTLRPIGLPGTRPALGFGSFGDFHCAGGGDVNGDGVPDVYVGDYTARRERVDTGIDTTNTGRAYVFSGFSGRPLAIFEAENDGDGLGPGRIVPDRDGDRRAEVFNAAYTFGVDGVQVGKGYLYRYRGLPFCDLLPQLPICSGPKLQLRRTLTGTGVNGLLGIDALPLGDIDGDRRGELMLTGIDTANGQGRVLIVAGRRGRE